MTFCIFWNKIQQLFNGTVVLIEYIIILFLYEVHSHIFNKMEYIVLLCTYKTIIKCNIFLKFRFVNLVIPLLYFNMHDISKTGIKRNYFKVILETNQDICKRTMPFTIGQTFNFISKNCSCFLWLAQIPIH